MNVIKRVKILRLRIKLLIIFSGVAIIVIGMFLIMGGEKTNNKDTPVEQQETVTQEQVPETPVQEPVVPQETPAVVEKKKTPPPVVEPSSKWPVMLTNTEASSLTVVVNKKHKLPSDYVPELTAVTGGQMRPEAAQAMTSMLFKANEAGVPMKIVSSYRSYSTQVSTYNKWVAQSGQAKADTYSARPGHSEHQTGLTADLGVPDGTCSLEICFGSTAQGIWLAANAASYGFIIRYESDTEAITGYQYEPWHVRYLGVDTATSVVNSGQTLDQYYGVEAGGYN